MRLVFIAALLISSCLASNSLIQTLRSQAKAPAHLGTNIYFAEIQWGGPNGPWIKDGQWYLGGKAAKRVKSVQSSSSAKDGGKNLLGTIIYDGEDPISFKAERVFENNYQASVQPKGSATWNLEGIWVIGGRAKQPIVDVKITGDGNTFSGSVTYQNEGPVSFRAKQN